MHIDIITVGKSGRGWVRDAAGEYTQRIGHYATVSVSEVRAERHRKGMSSDKVMAAEAGNLRRAIPQGAYTIALTPGGESVTSESFSLRLADLGLHGRSNLAFLIGGAYGLHPDLIATADWRLSLSPLTFSHDLALVLLVEQIYRAFTILRNEPYHK